MSTDDTSTPAAAGPVLTEGLGPLVDSEEDPARLWAEIHRLRDAVQGPNGHKQHPDGGWCYMFRDEPHGACLKHTARAQATPRLPVGADHDCALTRGGVLCRVCDMNTIAENSKTPNTLVSEPPQVVRST